MNFFWTLEIFFIGREFLKFSFCRRGILKFGGSYFLLVASYFLLVVFTFCRGIADASQTQEFWTKCRADRAHLCDDPRKAAMTSFLLYF